MLIIRSRINAQRKRIADPAQVVVCSSVRPARVWVASPLARERGKVRVDAAQFAPKLLRAGSWNSEPLTFILSPLFEGRGGPPTASTDVQRSTGLNLLTHN